MAQHPAVAAVRRAVRRTLAEVERATVDGTVFAPRALAVHLAAVLSGDVPNSPLDIEV